MAQQRVDNLFAGENWTTVYTAFTNIDLKSYDFDSIREALLAYVSQTYPDKFNDFIASSEFIAILDLVAYLGHSLAFRTDLNARENFLDTAERRESILRLAKTLGYNKSRPTNARGFLKIVSVSTNQPIKDSNGKSLANKRIHWNDSNNDNWYDDFASILNATLTKDSRIDDPAASMSLIGSENYLHYINENPTSKATRYSFTTNIASAKRKFDVVRAEFKDGMIVEGEPNKNQYMTIIARDDNLGPASDRNGFFVYSKAGELKFKDVDYTTKLTNRVERILDTNISNTDVWVQKLNSQNSYLKPVTIVDNSTRQNAIYNALRSGSNDLASVRSLQDNGIEITYPDGIYGNAAYGKYRIWYRVADNTNFTVNRDDIKNVKITIPYIADDGRSYRLDLTLNSTIDFTENFSGENYYSVKRIAPKSYYTQDRMVNGQDYNVLPLTLGSNIVSKAKAVNTTFAGNSRFFEMDDVTGHHSTISVNGNDGSLYFEDEFITMEFYLNPQQADIDSFIRNELVKTIAHPIVENQFYYLHKDDALVKNTTINNMWNPDTLEPSNLLKGYISGFKDIREGDFIKIGDYWYTIMAYNPLTETLTNSGTITLDRPAVYGDLANEIVYAYPKVFNDAEVDFLKDIISNNNTDTFYIAFDAEFDDGYGILSGADGLNWTLISGEVVTPAVLEVIEATQLYIKVQYFPGIRRTESRYVATIFGKNIVFESRDQVKFFYSNNQDVVIDNETHKANTDLLYINYAEGDYAETFRSSDSYDKEITVGFGPVVDIDETNSTFTISHACSGAEMNYNYLQNDESISTINFKYELVSHDCLSAEIPAPSGLPYEDAVYPLSVADDVLIDTVIIQYDVNGDETLNNVTFGPFTPTHWDGNVGNVGNVSSSSTYHSDDYLVLTSEYMETNGFVGTANAARVSSLISDGHLLFVDNNELISPVTLETATASDYGTQVPIVSYTVGTNGVTTFKFTFYQNDIFGFTIDESDSDIYMKQLAYCQLEFVDAGVYTVNDIYIKTAQGDYVSQDCLTLLTPEETGIENTYRVVVWCNDVLVNDVVDIYSGVDGTFEVYKYFGRITATFTDNDYVIYRDKAYRTVGSLIVSKYITDEGYVDYSKVILSSKDVSGDPYAMVDAITDYDTISYMILESYTLDDHTYYRASNYAVASTVDVNTNEFIPETAQLYYEVDADTWYLRTTQGWVETTNYTENTTGDIVYLGVNYRVVEGKSYVVDEYMSYRWDHYADKDKRIDPSTSNIVDVYILSTDYVRRINEWKDGGYLTTMPLPPSTYELNKVMESINSKAAITDHVSYIPAKFKFLFGDFADEQNQAYFKVVKKGGTSFTDSEIKTRVAEKVNQYFDLNNWDFGETFYFSELAAYLHVELSDYISSVVITPKYSSYDYKNMISIDCEVNEIFMSLISSANVKIIDKLTSNDLTGE